MLIQNRKQGFYFILTVSIAHTKSLYPKVWALMDLWSTTHIKITIFARKYGLYVVFGEDGDKFVVFGLYLVIFLLVSVHGTGS